MPKIDLDAVREKIGTSYPEPFAQACARRVSKPVARAAGLETFAANLVTIPPGAWASQRHWHSHEDEFVYMIEGELVLVEDDGETLLVAGDCAAWKAGETNGHHLQNRSEADARYLVVGGSDGRDACVYPDIDMKTATDRYGRAARGEPVFLHKDGTPY